MNDTPEYFCAVVTYAIFFAIYIKKEYGHFLPAFLLYIQR